MIGAQLDDATMAQIRQRLERGLVGSLEPRTVVNRAGSFVGALPEKRFVYSVLALARAGASGGVVQ